MYRFIFFLFDLVMFNQNYITRSSSENKRLSDNGYQTSPTQLPTAILSTINDRTKCPLHLDVHHNMKLNICCYFHYITVCNTESSE